MELQVLQSDLSKALSLAQRFVSTRGTLPILSNFLLEGDKTSLKIFATNLEMSISLKLGAKVEKEGSVTVQGKSFSELISNLNAGTVKLTLIKEELKVESAGFDSSLLTTPPNDFPAIPQSIDKKNSFTLPGKDLVNALSKVLFSASNDETRPILGGVLFVFGAESLNLVASDGFRLSQKSIKLGKNLAIDKKQIVIPKPFLLELIKFVSSDEEITLELKEKDNQLVIKIGDIYLSTRLIEGSFPDFEKIIPKSTSTSVLVDRNDLSKGIKLSAVFAREENGVIKIKVKENSLEIESESAKGGKQVNSIEAKVTGGNLEISFNYKFIEEFLSIAKGEEVEIKLIDQVTAAIFVDPLDKDFLHLIMPVRIQN